MSRLEIMKTICENDCKMSLSDHRPMANIDNIKHLVPFHEDKSVKEEEALNSRMNFFQQGEDDAARQRTKEKGATRHTSNREQPPRPNASLTRERVSHPHDL